MTKAILFLDSQAACRVGAHGKIIVGSRESLGSLEDSHAGDSGSVMWSRLMPWLADPANGDRPGTSRPSCIFSICALIMFRTELYGAGSFQLHCGHSSKDISRPNELDRKLKGSR